MASIQAHIGETVIRARLTDYVRRFVRIASAVEESSYGSSSLGFPVRMYGGGALGSGVVFHEDQPRQREMAVNAGRVEAWRQLVLAPPDNVKDAWPATEELSAPLLPYQLAPLVALLQGKLEPDGKTIKGAFWQLLPIAGHALFTRLGRLSSPEDIPDRVAYLKCTKTILLFVIKCQQPG